jgi:hypothetical protein
VTDKFLYSFFLFLLFCGSLPSEACAQEADTVRQDLLLDSTSVELTLGYRGKAGVVLTRDNVPLPFAIITNPAGRVITMADVNGVFPVPATRRGRSLPLVVHHPDYAPLPVLLRSPLPDSVVLRVQEAREPAAQPGGERADAIIKRVLGQREKQDLSELPGFTYRSYNKFAVNVDRQPLRKYVPKFIRRRLPFLVPPGDRNYHLYLMETVTRREFRESVQDRETILASRATGINDPTLLTPVTQLQPLNIFDEYLRIVTNDFVSPLSPHTYSRYNFQLVQAFPYQKDSLYVVRFEPEGRRKFNGLAGYLYINSRDYSISQVVAQQAGESNLKTQFFQNYRRTEDGFYFPQQIRSVVAFRNLSNKELRFFGTYSSYLDSLQLLSPELPGDKSFDEVLVKAVPEAGIRPDAYWDMHRKVTLSPMNLYTQEFYDSLQLVKDFDRYLRFVNKVLTTTVPFKFLDIKLKYLFRYNNYEGTRPGFGVQTNELLSSRFNVLGWVGYGFRDAGLKYGTVLTVFPDPQKQSSVSFMYQKEVEESGTPNFSFDRRQFSSELIRTYRIRIMDMVEERRLTVETRQFPHFAYSFSVSDNSKFPAFNYRFRDNPRQAYSYFEIGVGVKFAYQEKFVLTPDKKVSVGSPHPIAWLHYTQGLRGVMNGEFNYAKLDAKVEQSWKILFKGVTTAQLIGGVVLGAIPYSNLYNGNGSYAFASVVTHNSFETMGYNEFLNSNYVSLFLSHNFGKLILRKGDFNPDLELLHNMGFGTLSNPEDHHGLAFKTMEKGYFESGFFANNLYQFQVSFAKIGIGAGFFYRYGPYADEKALRNIYFKFSTRLGL